VKLHLVWLIALSLLQSLLLIVCFRGAWRGVLTAHEIEWDTEQ
jgi:hypothetical protein